MKNLILKDLQDLIQDRLHKMMTQNPSRINFYDKYRDIIRDYNNEQDRVTIEKTFEELMKLSNDLSEEEKRYVREGFENDEQLSIFDILMKNDLNKEDIKKIKNVAVELLNKIKEQLKGMDHPFDKKTTKSIIVTTIRDVLWMELPESYGEDHTHYRNAIYNYVRMHYGGVA